MQCKKEFQKFSLFWSAFLSEKQLHTARKRKAWHRHSSRAFTPPHREIVPHATWGVLFYTTKDTLVSERTGLFAIVRISSHALDPRSSWADSNLFRYIVDDTLPAAPAACTCMASHSQEDRGKKADLHVTAHRAGFGGSRCWQTRASCCCIAAKGWCSTRNTSGAILHTSSDFSAFWKLHPPPRIHHRHHEWSVTITFRTLDGLRNEPSRTSFMQTASPNQLEAQQHLL